MFPNCHLSLTHCSQQAQVKPLPKVQPRPQSTEDVVKAANLERDLRESRPLDSSTKAWSQSCAKMQEMVAQERVETDDLFDNPCEEDLVDMAIQKPHISLYIANQKPPINNEDNNRPLVPPLP